MFSNLIYLNQIEKFPNKILLNGPKGIGKKLLVTHLLNYLYSKNNDQYYDIKNNECNINNKLTEMPNINIFPYTYIIDFDKQQLLIDTCNNNIFTNKIDFEFIL